MRRAVRRRVFGFGAAGLLIAACSYDFDEYVEEGAARGGAAASSGGAGGTTAGVTAAGEAGANSTLGGNTTGGQAARGGAAGAVEAGEAGASASGAGGEAEGGAAGSGNGGVSAGGTANGGATSGGPAGGGTALAGAGGAAGADCDTLGGASFEGHCYFYVSSLLDFEAAQGACADAGATLVAINSVEEQRFLESTFFAPANDAWIGLSLAALTNPNASMCKAMPSACPFRWQTGEPLAYTKWGSHSASDSEPNYTGACVRLQGATLDWADQGCGERVRAICEAE